MVRSARASPGSARSGDAPRARATFLRVESYPTASPARHLTLAAWGDLPEDEPGELVDGRLVEDEDVGFLHDLVVRQLNLSQPPAPAGEAGFHCLWVRSRTPASDAQAAQLETRDPQRRCLLQLRHLSARQLESQGERIGLHGRAGRDPSSVRLVAISKTFSADYVRAAAGAGQVDFG